MTFRLSISPLRFALLIASAIALVPATAAPQSSGKRAAKVKKPPFSIQVQRNVVQVRVVVRDSHGRSIGGLTKDDFKLFDIGKRQVISSFTSEYEGPAPALPAGSGPAMHKPTAPGANAPPQRFVALLFDDLNMDFAQIAQLRVAAEHFLDSSLAPGDRVGLFTTSGQHEVAFTDDRDKIKSALLLLRPGGILAKPSNNDQCPPLTDYEAFRIDQMDDSQALAVATQEVVNCQCAGDAEMCTNPEATAKFAARRDWAQVEYQTLNTLRGLDRLVRVLSAMPGRRAIVFVSPGFISWTDSQQIDQIIDRAVRAGVVINSLDPRGLWVSIPGGDASSNIPALLGPLEPIQASLQRASKQEDSAVLELVADGTGGVDFHNNNNFSEGFRRTGGLPKASYVLAFTPEPLKLNGQYHKLRVKFAGGIRHSGWTIEARKGYYAPSGKLTPEEQARREIRQAVFSREVTEGLPVRVGTRWSESSPALAQLTVATHLDAHAIDFTAQNGLNVDKVEFTVVIFDHNGNYLKGTVKTVEFHVHSAVFKRFLAEGVTIPVRFPLSPGDYMVRVVVLDVGDGRLSSLTRSVDASN